MFGSIQMKWQRDLESTQYRSNWYSVDYPRQSFSKSNTNSLVKDLNSSWVPLKLIFCWFSKENFFKSNTILLALTNKKQACSWRYNFQIIHNTSFNTLQGGRGNSSENEREAATVTETPGANSRRPNSLSVRTYFFRLGNIQLVRTGKNRVFWPPSPLVRISTILANPPTIVHTILGDPPQKKEKKWQYPWTISK